MPLLIEIFSFFWLIRTFKAILFWIYLWQLKEYHIGRFLDHFRTYKGKRIFFNFIFLAKFFLLVLIFVNFLLAFYVLLLIYLAELLLIFKNGFKRPVWTKKTIFLALFSILFSIVFAVRSSQVLKNFGINVFVFWLLVFDILVPLIVSAVVLLFQPFFVLARNIVLEKAKNKRKKFKNVTVIGITGSYGKTSTKEFLATILSTKFKVLSTADHRNSEIGIAKTILEELNESHEVFIVEMGSYNKGGITLLCDIAKPKIGMVTGVNEQHLATFGSMENLLSAEGGQELLENLPKDGMLVVNGDNKYCLNLYKNAFVNKKIYTILKDRIDSDIWAQEISVGKDSVDFMALARDGGAAHVHGNVLGRHNVQNMLGAILVAKELGMSLEEISRACQNIRPEQAGIVLKKGIHGIDVIDSSYSSNPDGVMADLDHLSIFSGKKVVVMPCLIELGEKSAEIHREIGGKIAEVCDMAIITTKEKFEEIKSGVPTAVGTPTKVIFSQNPKEIFTLITTFLKSGDAVLLEGRMPSGLIQFLFEK